MHLPANQQRPGPSGYFDSYYNYSPMHWPPAPPRDPHLNPRRDLDSIVDRAVERAIPQIVGRLEEAGYRRDNAGGDSGTPVSNSCTATQTDVASSTGSRQQRHPPRPSDSAATNDSTQGTCAHTQHATYVGVRGRVEPPLDRGMLNCQ